ncbi:MAG: superoxide dismutase [Balneolaceae bacterium]|nr:superoxide dismutase [Balneolaceae bacterium]
MALGSVSSILAPAFFTTSCAANNRTGGYQSYDEIFNEVYPFSLADLPYSYDALETAIDAKTMEIHHGRHHQGYINNLNNALEDHADLQKMTLTDLVAGLNNLPEEVRTAVRNHGGGHLNHAIFWNTMSAEGGSPNGALKEAIDRDFGDEESLKEEFSSAAGDVFGSGWAWLAAESGGSLQVVQTPNQDNPLTDGLTPLFGVDVWEHAYYLNYQNRRGDYVDAFWDLIYWDKVAEIYQEAVSA